MTSVTALSTTGRAATEDREAATLHLRALTPGDRSRSGHECRTGHASPRTALTWGRGIPRAATWCGDVVAALAAERSANAAAWVVTQSARGDAGGHVGGAELPA
jgi:hypothetical protein